MQDTNLKTWGLMLLIGLVLLTQLFKHFPSTGSPGMPWETANLRAGNTPYSVKGEERQHQRRPMARVAGQDAVLRKNLATFIAANAPTSTSTPAPEKGAEGKVAPKKDDDKCEEGQVPKIDPKTGKPVPCKKKKKKKEEPKVEPTAQLIQPSADEHQSIDSAVMQAAGTGQIPQPAATNKPDDAFDTLENWVKRLLNSPDLAETKVFIDHYQRSLVTPDIFYKVTQMMLDDSRPDMKSLGVLCAGLTPSIMSFQMLATIDKTERADSPARVQADQFLARYTEMGNLGIIERILRAPTDIYTTVMAEQKLNSAAHAYLIPVNTTLTAANGSGATASTTPTAQSAATTARATAALARNVTYFTRYVLVLQNLEHSTDANVVDQAKLTLADLQSLLAKAAPTAAPAGATVPTTTAGI